MKASKKIDGVAAEAACSETSPRGSCLSDHPQNAQIAGGSKAPKLRQHLRLRKIYDDSGIGDGTKIPHRECSGSKSRAPLLNSAELNNRDVNFNILSLGSI